METIIIKLDSKKLENPDLDIRYDLPDRIAEYTDNKVTDNGYDYLTDTELAVWLAAEDAEKAYGDVVELLKKEKFCDNDLSATAEVYVSKEPNADINKCRRVYP